MEEKKITSHLGHIIQRGNRVNIKIRLAPERNRDRTVMRVSINTETGRIAGDMKNILLFAQHFYLPLMEAHLSGFEGEGQVSADSIEKAKSAVAEAVHLIDHYTKEVGDFAVGLGADGLMNGLERVFFDIENE